jgi:hypothetical protein
MKKNILVLTFFGLICVAYADVYRLLDTPNRCVIDYNEEGRILDFSQCDVAKDSYFGDRTFSTDVACIYDEGKGNVFLNLHCKSIYSHYFELTEHTNYSCELESFSTIDTTYSADVFDIALEYNYIRKCSIEIGGSDKVRKISSYEYEQKNITKKSHCAYFSLEQEYYLMQACVRSCGSNRVDKCAERIKEFECRENMSYSETKRDFEYSCPIRNPYE